jgi:hypothetical protein
VASTDMSGNPTPITGAADAYCLIQTAIPILSIFLNLSTAEKYVANGGCASTSTRSNKRPNS